MDEIVVSDALLTPALTNGSLVTVIPTNDELINYTQGFLDLFQKVTIIPSIDSSPTAITVKVSKTKLANLLDQIKLLTSMGIKNIQSVVDTMTYSYSSASSSDNDIELSRSSVSTLSDFITSLPEIDALLQNIKDEVSMLLTPVNVPDVVLVPNEDYLGKVAGALGDDKLVNDILEQSVAVSSNLAVQSVGDVVTNLDAYEQDLDIANFSSTSTCKTNVDYQQIFLEFDKAFSALFSAKKMLSPLRNVNPAEISPDDLKVVNPNNNIIEQDWAATSKTVHDKVAAIRKHQKYVSATTSALKYHSNNVSTLYSTTVLLINHSTIDLIPAEMNDEIVTGIYSKRTYTVKEIRGVLSTLKSIWSNFTHALPDLTPTILSSAASIVSDSLTNINKVYNTKFDSNLLSDVIQNGFSGVAGTYGDKYLSVAANLGVNVIPLLYRNLSAKVPVTSDSKANLLTKVREYGKLISDSVAPPPAGYVGKKNYTIKRRKNLPVGSSRVSGTARRSLL